MTQRIVDLKNGDEFRLDDKIYKVVGRSRWNTFISASCKEETLLRTFRAEELLTEVEVTKKALLDSPTHSGTKEGWTPEQSGN